MKKVKLHYRPYARRRSNEIAYEVSSDHVVAINDSLGKKAFKNWLEQKDTSINARHFNCKQ